ncbi:hypothetical protein BRYFOR_09750 [Marvinbryantia formatexigens DSM 14469]|uniref:Uncharacterized protein n=1 Tax=Marvinbryantia formatexigens DSM 14469 TaxID=478749 RepID=C6LM51_9FIRM|nr:hypothetical protein [Marvinbryantia formatexigens]EET58309.1 hypothetical protein BRYFOR_09750 [Marvinbryantia formatexigens DSM 14469]
MRRKQIAVILGLALAVSGVSAFAEEDTEAVSETVLSSEETGEQEKSDIIIGEVKEVGEDSITIAVGTLPEDDTDAGESGASGDVLAEDDTEAASEDTTDTATADDTSADTSDTSGTAQEPELELTGEEKTVTVAEDVTILQVDWETAKESLKDLEDSQEDGTAEEADDTETLTDSDSTAAEDTTEAETAENTELTDTADEGTEELSEAEELALTDILEGDILAIQLDEDGNAVQIMVVQQS